MYSLSLFNHLIAGRGGRGFHGTDQPVSRVEEVDGAAAVCDESGFQSERLQQFHLHFGACGGDRSERVRPDGVHLVLELLRLDVGHVARLGDLELVLLPDELVLCLASSRETLQL